MSEMRDLMNIPEFETDVPAEDAVFSLEEILVEFGGAPDAEEEPDWEDLSLSEDLFTAEPDRENRTGGQAPESGEDREPDTDRQPEAVSEPDTERETDGVGEPDTDGEALSDGEPEPDEKETFEDEFLFLEQAKQEREERKRAEEAERVRQKKKLSNRLRSARKRFILWRERREARRQDISPEQVRPPAVVLKDLVSSFRAAFGGARRDEQAEVRETVPVPVPEPEEVPAPVPEPEETAMPVPETEPEESAVPIPEPEPEEVPVSVPEPEPEEVPVPVPEPEKIPAPVPEPERPEKKPERKKPLFRTSSVAETIGNTVDSVLSERKNKKASRRKALFSRRRLWDTRDLYEGLETAEAPADIVPEPPLGGAAAEFKAEYERRSRILPAVTVISLLPAFLLLLERLGFSLPLWTENIPARTVITFLCLVVTGYLCRQIFTGSSSVFLCGMSAIAAACDCIARLFLVNRAGVDTYGAIACLGLAAAQWSVTLESRAMYDTFRSAAVDPNPPYLVTDTEDGACKQRGSVPGFYTTAMGGNVSSMWMTLLLPLILAASVVFATLSSVGQERNSDFFLNWSAILAAGTTLCLPLCWALPWARLARRLHGSGSAVAGWNGAEHISRRKTMILTDGDLFPPGTVQITGVKLYSDEMEQAVSCAAAMTRAAACGLERIFDDLRKSEMAAALPVDNFSFYEEGGYAGTIQGQSVLLGTRSFLRRMGVPLPRDLRVTTGMFLAVDRHLIAVFAIKYRASENVDFALHMIRRNHVTPILAARDPNITPALLRRKFRRTVKIEYPDLAERVAFSEAEFDQDIPRALLFREGLLPFAETVIGSRRLCGAVRRSTMLGLFGSMSGMLLAFYLVFQGQYALLSPLGLLLFLLLWTVPALLLMDLL